MRNFRRSLRYLRPYWGRLTIAVLCTLLICVLWACGLGMILPGAKILLAPEGLHGWAYGMLAGDRLGAQLVQRVVPPQYHEETLTIDWAVDVVSVKKAGPAGLAGLAPGQWLIGLADAESADRLMRADDLCRALARRQAGEAVALRVLDPAARKIVVVTVTLGAAGSAAGAVAWVAQQFPEPQTYAERFPILLALLVASLVIGILRDALRVIQEYLAISAVLHSVNDLRRENYNVALRQPVSFFTSQGTTDTMSRFLQDTGILARGQIVLLGKTMLEPGKAIAALVVAMMVSWKLTLMVLVAGPPAFLLIRYLGRAMRRTVERALTSLSAMLEVLEETLHGIRVVKAYTMEAAERRRFTRVNREVVRQQLRMSLIEALTGPLIETLGTLVAMVAIALAGYWVLHGRNDLDAEKFLTLLGALTLLFDSVRRLASVSTQFHASEAAAKRLFELRDRPQEKSPPGAPSLPRHTRSVEFRGVSFRYDGAADYALREVSIEVRAGQTVAIVGPNGAGKTTLAMLLPRLLEPCEGSVLIDGRDIAQHSLRSLRRQIGLVLQNAVLFHATIAENIAYGRNRPHMDKVLEAARRAYVDEFVSRLPQGYETVVGQRGATLSGGEQQRIAIARAILRDPAILIFDEAMSQVDADSERRIQLALKEFSRGRTTFIIAHRFATVLSADHIVVLSAGRLLDSGTHQELLGRCDLYRHLYNTQFVDTGGTAQA